jgi:hypothetical protein
MWGRERKGTETAVPENSSGGLLKDALRLARVTSADRTGVVVDLRDAELARLEMLNEALDPLFSEVPAEVELFDRGISRGDTPRLWIDAVAHVDMGRDKRRYRLLLDGRYGRKVLAESNEIPAMIDAVKHYVASRMIERERALAEDGSSALSGRTHQNLAFARRHRHWRTIRTLLLGAVLGAAAVLAILWYLALHYSQ